MHAVLGAKLRDRQLAPDCLQRYFRFEFSAITLAGRLGHLNSSFPKDEPSLSSCPIRGDPLFHLGSTDGSLGRKLSTIMACALLLRRAWPVGSSLLPKLPLGWLAPSGRDAVLGPTPNSRAVRV